MKLHRIVLFGLLCLAVGPGSVGATVGPPLGSMRFSGRGADMLTSNAQDETLIAAAPSAVRLKGDITRVLLAEPGGGAVAARLRALEPDRRVYLIIGNMSAAEEPGVPYRVFVDLAAGSRGDANSPGYVGTITFFNAVSLEGTPPESKDTRFFSFDITRIVGRLQSKNLLTEDTTVTLEAGGEAAPAAHPQIGRLEIVER